MNELKRLSIGDLMETTVITPARQAEPLYRAASAISVLRSDDLRRAGVVNIPDALRLVPGMQVAQQNGRSWAISARGFNLVEANKLEVVFDGRSVYTPFFSGTFWDVQDTLLPDIEQIEVVRGPGGTLWGSNAVNGVINIRTKSARDTVGGLLIAGAGTRENGFIGVRQGWRVSERTYARAYARSFARDWLLLSDGSAAQPDRKFFQTGFRTDTYDGGDQITTQGNFYSDRFGSDDYRDRTNVAGGNLRAHLHREHVGGAVVDAQAYWDHTERTIPGIFDETRDTGEVSLQMNQPLSERHRLLWSLQARGSRDESGNVGRQILLPAKKTLWLFGAHVRDQVTVVPDRLTFAFGSKFEHHTFAGFEYQPSARIAWHPAALTTVWGAVTRAVRTPVRIDRDLVFPATGAPTFQGNEQFESEKLFGYQLGVRKEFGGRVTLDVATYYNRYHDLRSSERAAGPGTPVTFKNGYEAITYGAEISASVALNARARVDVGYAYLHKQVDAQPDAVPLNPVSSLGNDPRHTGFARFSADLGRGVEFDCYVRAVSSLPAPEVPHYVTADLRIGWHVTPGLEWSVVVRDLGDPQHPEFGANNPRREEVPRSAYTQVAWTF